LNVFITIPDPTISLILIEEIGTQVLDDFQVLIYLVVVKQVIIITLFQDGFTSGEIPIVVVIVYRFLTKVNPGVGMMYDVIYFHYTKLILSQKTVLVLASSSIYDTITDESLLGLTEMILSSGISDSQ
jgi:hypothetical protein